MDYEKLTKDESILHLVRHLTATFGRDAFYIDDHWKADLYAVGLSDYGNRYLLYISTYSLPENNYNVVLETKAHGKASFSSEQSFENLSLLQVEDLFRQCFTAKCL